MILFVLSPRRDVGSLYVTAMRLDHYIITVFVDAHKWLDASTYALEMVSTVLGCSYYRISSEVYCSMAC